MGFTHRQWAENLEQSPEAILIPAAAPMLVLTDTRREYEKEFKPWVAGRWPRLAQHLGERFLRWVYAPVREEVGRMDPSGSFWKSTLPSFLVLAVYLAIFPRLNSLPLAGPQWLMIGAFALGLAWVMARSEAWDFVDAHADAWANLENEGKVSLSYLRMAEKAARFGRPLAFWLATGAYSVVMHYFHAPSLSMFTFTLILNAIVGLEGQILFHAAFNVLSRVPLMLKKSEVRLDENNNFIPPRNDVEITATKSSANRLMVSLTLRSPKKPSAAFPALLQTNERRWSLSFVQRVAAGVYSPLGERPVAPPGKYLAQYGPEMRIPTLAIDFERRPPRTKKMNQEKTRPTILPAKVRMHMKLPTLYVNGLSSAEKKILQKRAQGWNLQEIATKLHMALHTVKIHEWHMHNKLSLGEVRYGNYVKHLYEEGLVEPPARLVDAVRLWVEKMSRATRDTLEAAITGTAMGDQIAATRNRKESTIRNQIDAVNILSQKFFVRKFSAYRFNFWLIVAILTWVKIF